MAVFFGCVLIAATILFVGRKVGRILWHLLLVVENDIDSRAAREGRSLETTPVGPPKAPGKHASMTK